MRRVDALDIESRVGLGIAQALRVFERDREVQSLVAHFAQDEVGRAVDDSGYPLDAVGAQALAQRLDDRYAAGDRGLKSDHHATGMRGGEYFGPMHREQRLVRGHHVFAGGDGLHHQLARDAIAADQFNDDVDLRISDHRARVGDHLHAVARERLCPHGVEVGDHGDGNAASRAAHDLGLVAPQHGEGAAADSPHAQQPHLNSIHGHYSGWQLTRTQSIRPAPKPA